jgi:hypothetical protein
MNSPHANLLFLFVIILLGLAISYFINNRPYTESMTNRDITFTSDTGSFARLTTNSNGIGVITFINTYGKESVYIYDVKNDNINYIKTSTYIGLHGGKAVLIEGSEVYMLEIFSPTGKLIVSLTSDQLINATKYKTKTTNNTTNSNYDNYNHYSKTSLPSVFYGSNGGTARVIQSGGSATIVITNKNGSTEIYYINNKGILNDDPTIHKYYGPNGTSAKIVTDNNGKKQVVITAPNGRSITYTDENMLDSEYTDDSFKNYNDDAIPLTTRTPTSSSLSASLYNLGSSNKTDYSSYLPPGISKSMIPPGQENLYILKSEVVPPVCPTCPEPIVKCPNNIDANKIPPCPPCARCPEPAFDCKKVPNYNAFNPDYMPVPALADFSGFGM